MTDKEIVQVFLETKEWQTFECKRAAIQPYKLLETVVAFSNSDGGYIVIGIEDPTKTTSEQRLIGISENDNNVSDFLKLIDKEIDPQLGTWNKFELGITNIHGKPDVLAVIKVEKSNDVHSLKKGDTFIRKGKQNVKIGSSEIIRLKYEKGSIKFEDEITTISELDVLDLALLERYKVETQSESLDNWQFLKDNGLAIKQKGTFYLTKAGILLFSKNPAVELKNKCGVKISHYYGNKALYTGEPNFVSRPITIEGALLYQIDQAVAYFRNLVKNSPPKLSSSVFKPSLLIPEWAFQEAITNAVIHRNYSIQNDIQVRIFDDRIEIESPGCYPGHVTVGNIRTERFARNPLILRTLNRFQSAPNLDIGEGVDRMFKVMKENNLYEPLYFPPSLRPNSVLLFLYNLHKMEYWDTVTKFLGEHFRITNSEARKITGIADTLKMTRLLNNWVAKGLLERVGKGYKGSMYYKWPGSEVIGISFSNTVENGRRKEDFQG